jgi:hypothetical protein
MGWDTTFLQKVIDTCKTTYSAGDINECALFEQISVEEANRCKFKVPQGLANEDVNGPFKLLPGGIKADK